MNALRVLGHDYTNLRKSEVRPTYAIDCVRTRRPVLTFQSDVQNSTKASSEILLQNCRLTYRVNTNHRSKRTSRSQVVEPISRPILNKHYFLICINDSFDTSMLMKKQQYWFSAFKTVDFYLFCKKRDKKVIIILRTNCKRLNLDCFFFSFCASWFNFFNVIYKVLYALTFFGKLLCRTSALGDLAIMGNRLLGLTQHDDWLSFFERNGFADPSLSWHICWNSTRNGSKIIFTAAAFTAEWDITVKKKNVKYLKWLVFVAFLMLSLLPI